MKNFLSFKKGKKKEDKFCKNHPDKKAFAHCAQCGGDFCQDCTVVRLISEDFTAYICKECGGKCELIEAPVIQPKDKPQRGLIKKEGISKKEQKISVKEGIPQKPGQYPKCAFVKSLVNIVIYPLKRKGLFIVPLAGVALFSSSRYVQNIYLIGPLLGTVFMTYFLIYLYRIAETSFLGYDCLPGLIYPDEWFDIFKSMIYASLALLILFLPGFLYFIYSGDFSFLFLLFLFAGYFLLPIIFCRIVITKKLNSLNIFSAACSIGRAFWPYVLMCFVLMGLGLLLSYINVDLLVNYVNDGKIIRFILSVYFLFAAMRLLGLFARFYSDRIIKN